MIKTVRQLQKLAGHSCVIGRLEFDHINVPSTLVEHSPMCVPVAANESMSKVEEAAIVHHGGDVHRHPPV